MHYPQAPYYMNQHPGVYGLGRTGLGGDGYDGLMLSIIALPLALVGGVTAYNRSRGKSWGTSIGLGIAYAVGGTIAARAVGNAVRGPAPALNPQL